MVEFSPYTHEFHEDPYPLYQRLRDEAPVYHNADVDFWALSRHADVLAVFKNAKRFPDYAVQPNAIERVHSVNVRGFASLPVKV